MLALSVKQPWAELIARGQKKKEFRTWTRSCFGELLIVASKSVEADDIADEGLDVASLVFGRAVCVVDFYKVTGDDGDYAWHFRNPRRVHPIEVRGSASLYRVPDERIRFKAYATRVAPKAVRVPQKASAKAVRTPPRERTRGTRASIPAFLEPKKRPRSPNRPACGATDSIPIGYGDPSPELWAAVERTPENAASLLALARHVFEHGTEGRLYAQLRKYRHEGGKVYWSMDATPDSTTLINRCDENQTYEARRATGTLPSIR